MWPSFVIRYTIIHRALDLSDDSVKTVLRSLYHFNTRTPSSSHLRCNIEGQVSRSHLVQLDRGSEVGKRQIILLSVVLSASISTFTNYKNLTRAEICLLPEPEKFEKYLLVYRVPQRFRVPRAYPEVAGRRVCGCGLWRWCQPAHGESRKGVQFGTGYNQVTQLLTVRANKLQPDILLSGFSRKYSN